MKETLRFGLDNHTLPKKPEDDDIKCNVEPTLHSLIANGGLAIDYESRNEIKFATKNFTNNAKGLCSGCKNVALHGTFCNF